MAWQRPAACNNISDVEVSLEELMIGLVIVWWNALSFRAIRDVINFSNAKLPRPNNQISKSISQSRENILNILVFHPAFFLVKFAPMLSASLIALTEQLICFHGRAVVWCAFCTWMIDWHVTCDMCCISLWTLAPQDHKTKVVNGMDLSTFSF